MKTILSALVFLSVFFISCTHTSSTSIKASTTTRTFNGGELRYNETITDEQANAMGDYLVKNEFFDGTPITVQVGKVNNIVHFAVILNDEDAYSDEYQTLGKVMIDEIEQQVFKGNTVEIDWCDENFKVKKNIKGNRGEVAAVDVTPASTTTTDMPTAEAAYNNGLLTGFWGCNNITGGEPKDAATAAKELEILKNNFTFDFNQDGSFGGRFPNQADLTSPTEVSGSYTVKGNTISFHQLTVGGQPTDQQMNFDISLTDKQLQLTSKQSGYPDLVMTFDRTL